MSESISLQTIASAAGVTRTTVSLALRNHPRISTQTGERIRSLARSLGYRPNADLSRMMRTIRGGQPAEACPVIAIAHDGHCAPALLAALHHCCREAGYRPDPMNCQDLGGARLGQILHARNISALLLAHPGPAALLRTLDAQGLCVCVVAEAPVGHHRIDPRHAAADWVAREAVDLLDQLLRHHRYGTPDHPKVIRADG